MQLLCPLQQSCKLNFPIEQFFVLINNFQVNHEQVPFKDTYNSVSQTLLLNAFKVSSNTAATHKLAKTDPGYIHATVMDKKLVKLNWGDYRRLWLAEYLDVSVPLANQIINCVGKIRKDIQESCCQDYRNKVENISCDFARRYWLKWIEGVKQPKMLVYNDVVIALLKWWENHVI
jgi:hypothetical protein